MHQGIMSSRYFAILSKSQYINKILMNYKIILNNFSHLNQKQWSIVSNETQVILTNSYTMDQFVYEKLINDSSNKLQICKARAQYTIPNTPHIILGNGQKDQQYIEIFVQTAPYKLDKLIRKNSCKTHVHLILKNMIKTVEFLVKKFGFFQLRYEMIKVTKSHHFLIWIHQNYNAMYRQYPLGSKNIYKDYKIMVNQILMIFQTVGCRKQLEDIRLKLETEKLISFEKLKILIENSLKYINKQKESHDKLNLYPQFLKKRNLPHLNLEQQSTTTNLSITPKYINNSQTGNETPAKSETSVLSNRQGPFFQFFPTQDYNNNYHQNQISESKSFGKNNKRNGIFLSPNGKFTTNNFYSKCGKSQSQIDQSKYKIGKVSQSVLSDDQRKIKKKDFRESSNLCSRPRLESSITSSGKIKFQDVSSTASSFRNENLLLVSSSMGAKQSKGIKQTFKVKQSKIIEQNSEQINISASVTKIQKQNDYSLMQLQLEKDFDGLLDTSQPTDSKVSNGGLIELEEQINKILSG